MQDAHHGRSPDPLGREDWKKEMTKDGTMSRSWEGELQRNGRLRHLSRRRTQESESGTACLAPIGA